jgi:molecular chaperone Hsp33
MRLSSAAMDELLRAITPDGAYRVAVARTTDTVAEALRRHQPTPKVALALARALTSTALLSVGEKEIHRIAVQWHGRGPMRSLQAQISGDGSLRGYPSDPTAIAPSVSEALGRGGISVVEIDLAGRATQGSLHLMDGSIDVDAESFLRLSEQVPSRLRVFEGDGAVVGVLLQTLGGAPGDALLADGLVSPAFLDRSLDANLPLEELASAALGGAEVTVVGRSPLRWACACSREKVERGVALLGVQELLDMISKNEPGQVRCDFCAEDYVVSVERLCALVDELDPA